jgi:ubiquinone/menaquinone biosynthesis C-methylase UbiE
VIPFIGDKVAKDRKAYEYLVESIRKFPTATRFKSMIEKEGFDLVEYKKLCFGVVAIHIGYKC